MDGIVVGAGHNGPAKLTCRLGDRADLSVFPGDPGLVIVLPALGWWRAPRETYVELQLDGDLLGANVHEAPRGLTEGWVLDRAARAIRTSGTMCEVELLGPAELESRVGLSGGCIHHLPHVPAHAFCRRPGARTPLPGLYLAGAGAWPAARSPLPRGRNAARAVLADLG